jgi:trans-2,3-dihydro-3-hydroxyanthranilate isomerase
MGWRSIYSVDKIWNMQFYIVDVFAEEKYAGNQLAVFTDASGLSTEQMQQIAREMNFSETTFILSSQPHNDGYDVRIFTPVKELPFAGHPTLGTAFILQQEILRQPVDGVVLNLKVGPIPVTPIYRGDEVDLLWMRQNSPTFGEVVQAEKIAPVLNLAPDDIDDRFPIQEVSTGVPFLIVPLKRLEALQRIAVNLDRLFALIESLQAKMIFCFCPQTRDRANQFSARMFAHVLGIPEDPATGSANGCFAGYLAQHRYLGDAPVDVRVEQGYEINRPSLLLLKAERVGEAIDVQVGGRVVLVARGEFV